MLGCEEARGKILEAALAAFAQNPFLSKSLEIMGLETEDR